MIGSTVQFYKYEYSSINRCNIQITVEGIILEKYIAPYLLNNEAVRGMTKEFIKVYTPIDFYLILTADDKLHRIPCEDIQKIIKYENYNRI